MWVLGQVQVQVQGLVLVQVRGQELQKVKGSQREVGIQGLPYSLMQKQWPPNHSANIKSRSPSPR